MRNCMFYFWLPNSIHHKCRACGVCAETVVCQQGSTVVITAGSDETHCLRVRGEVCQLDCTVCSGCWLWGKLSCVRVRKRRENERQTRDKHAWVCVCVCVRVCVCVCVCALYAPEGAEMVESSDWFPGTMQPCAPGKMSGGRRRRWREAEGRQTENISHSVNNYGVGRNVTQISLVQSAVIIFHKNTKWSETLCQRAWFHFIHKGKWLLFRENDTAKLFTLFSFDWMF